MEEATAHPFDPPRIEIGRSLLLAGLSMRYTCDGSPGISAQWQRFLTFFGRIPGQQGRVAYGVNHNADDNGGFDYLCGVEVSAFSGLPDYMNRLQLPQKPYAVFTHRGHVSTILRTHGIIWNSWLPPSGYVATGGPFFERYDETFDPATGLGGIEIWIPIRQRRL